MAKRKPKRKVDFSAIMARQFKAVHTDIQKHGHTFYWLKGGRGSTKSSLISLEIPLLLKRNPRCHAVVLRKVGRTIKDSVYPQVQWGIEQLGIAHKFKYKTSPPEIIYKHTKQHIYFFGMDDPMKIKSFKPPFGYVGIVWFEELDQFTGMDEMRSINQSLLRGGTKFWEFASFNPPKSRNAWVNEEILLDDDSRLVHHSTFQGVPKEWLGDLFFEEAARLKAKNELAYEHEYLGAVTGTGGAVFENVSDMEMPDGLVGNFDRIHDGLDFGFAVDPLAYVVMHYDRKHEDLYIFDEIYQQKLTNKQAAARIAPKANRRRIQADSAEPKSIVEMREFGLNVVGVAKGPDSVEHGMKWLQSLRNIYIDKRRAPNTYREFMCYEYERNRAGQFISAYPDKDNHTIDAVRYAMNLEMPRPTLKIMR